MKPQKAFQAGFFAWFGAALAALILLGIVVMIGAIVAGTIGGGTAAVTEQTPEAQPAERIVANGPRALAEAMIGFLETMDEAHQILDQIEETAGAPAPGIKRNFYSGREYLAEVCIETVFRMEDAGWRGTFKAVCDEVYFGLAVSEYEPGRYHTAIAILRDALAESR